MTTDGRRLGVYVHWPYCARICPYCDFNVYKARPVDADRWRDALIQDLRHWAARTPDHTLVSIYWGGGTPSLAPAEIVAAVNVACREFWTRRPDDAEEVEITLEANPSDIEPGRLEAFRRAGIARVSLGVQSLRDAALAFLGRDHSADEATRAVATVREVFDNLNVDAIYARPEQTPAEWADELSAFLALGADHLSLYQLTIESGTAFERAVRRGAFRPATDDGGADLFDLTQELTAAAGYEAYEISNHARPGRRSRHNQLYWRGDDYVGVGPGAHGRLEIDGERLAIETAKAPGAYLDRVERTRTGAASVAKLTAEERLIEKLAMGLRWSEGARLSPTEWRRIDVGLAKCAPDLVQAGKDGALIATPEGRRVLNAVVSELIA